MTSVQGEREGDLPLARSTNCFSDWTTDRADGLSRNPRVCTRSAMNVWTRRACPAALIGGLRRNLSALDFAGSMEVRSNFAFIDAEVNGHRGEPVWRGSKRTGPDQPCRGHKKLRLCGSILRLVRHHDGGVDGRGVGYILQGRIRAGGIEKDVIFLDAAPNLNAVKR